MPLPSLAETALPIPPGAVPSSGVRLAVISTPRCGNTWLRHLLAHAHGARELAVHNPSDLDWEALPSDCVLQIHWHPTAAFQALLQQHGFGVVVMARHPLDVLLSILHYALHDSSPQRWLEGEFGTEAPICGAMPGSAAFLRYATGPRAGALLSVSREWWEHPQACRVHYECLVADPLGELTRVVERIGAPPRERLADCVAKFTLGNLRSKCGTRDVPESGHHFWQGKPGHWKKLLPCRVANAIAAAHPAAFNTFDYDCDPDPALDDAQADACWIELNRQELTTRLWNFTPIKQRMEHAENQGTQLAQRCAELEAYVEKRTEILAGVDQQRLHAERRVAELQLALDDARQAIEVLSRAPTQRVAALVKRLLGGKKADFVQAPKQES